MIRLVFPELTEERRKGSGKGGKEERVRNAKVAVRNIRRDGNDAIQEAGKGREFPRTRSRNWKMNLQKMTDKYIKDSGCKLMEDKVKGNYDRLDIIV